MDVLFNDQSTRKIWLLYAKQLRFFLICGQAKSDFYFIIPKILLGLTGTEENLDDNASNAHELVSGLCCSLEEQYLDPLRFHETDSYTCYLAHILDIIVKGFLRSMNLEVFERLVHSARIYEILNRSLQKLYLNKY